MPGRRMLREIMSINDIYSFAEPIMEMLREDYGSYDADSLDEVRVEDAFAHRLKARGYEVRGLIEPVAVEPAPAAPQAASSEIVPITVVRARRPTLNGERTPSSTPPRQRRTTPAAPNEEKRPAASRQSRRSTADGSALSPDTSLPASDAAPASSSTRGAASDTSRPASDVAPAPSSTRAAASDTSRPASDAAPAPSSTSRASATGRTRRTTRTPRADSNDEA